MNIYFNDFSGSPLAGETTHKQFEVLAKLQCCVSSDSSSVSLGELICSVEPFRISPGKLYMFLSRVNSVVACMNPCLFIQCLLLKGLCKTKPCFKPTTLSAIITISLRSDNVRYIYKCMLCLSEFMCECILILKIFSKTQSFLI